MNSRYTQQQVEKIFSTYGYILKDIYINSKNKIVTVCPKGHEYSVALNAFNNGNRCATCSGKRKYLQEEVQLIFLKNNYILKDTYINNKKKMSVICPNKHLWKVSFNGLITQGYKCSVCVGNKKYTLDEVKKIFSKDGYKIISKKYLHNRGKLSVLCPLGHEWGATVFGYNMGYRCPTCAGNKKHTQEKISKIFHMSGYALKDIYRGNKIKVLTICPKGHEHRTTFQDFQTKKSRCSLCYNSSISNPEISLFEAIKCVYSKAQKFRDKKIKIEGKPHIQGFDIDIYIPELRKGIEFDGKYWHSDKGLKRSRDHWPQEDIHNYHQIKDSWFASKGIKILHIREEDWVKDKEGCIKRCLEFLGVK